MFSSSCAWSATFSSSCACSATFSSSCACSATSQVPESVLCHSQVPMRLPQRPLFPVPVPESFQGPVLAPRCLGVSASLPASSEGVWLASPGFDVSATAAVAAVLLTITAAAPRLSPSAVVIEADPPRILHSCTPKWSRLVHPGFIRRYGQDSSIRVPVQSPCRDSSGCWWYSCRLLLASACSSHCCSSRSSSSGDFLWEPTCSSSSLTSPS